MIAIKALKAAGICALWTAAFCLRADAQSCQAGEPREIIGARSFSLGGEAKLIGFDTFTNVPGAPVKYRRKAVSGTMHFARWDGSDCNVPSYPPAYDHSGVHVVGNVGNRLWYHWNIKIEPVEINVVEGSILYRVTRFDSYRVSENSPVKVYDVNRVAGGLQLLGAVGQERVASIGRAYTLWVDTGGGSPTIMDDSTFTIGIFYMQQWRDVWDSQTEFDQNDPTGSGYSENGDASTRYMASSSTFPLANGGNAAGPPSTASYGPFTTTPPASATRREMLGSEICHPVPGGGSARGKMRGNYTEELSVEDKDEDAMRRAFRMDLHGNPLSPYVSRGGSSTAYRTRRTTGYEISFSDVQFEVPVNITCEGVYRVHFNFLRKPHGSSAAGVPFTRTAEKNFKPGQEVLQGHFDIEQMQLMLPGGETVALEYDEDYTFVNATLEQGCGQEDPGASSFRRSSVHVRLSLGPGVGGLSAGALLLDAELISPAIYAPSALAPDSPVNGGTRVVRDDLGMLRQMKAPGALADIVPINASAYEVRFHAASEIGSADPATGIFAVGGAPYVVYRFENPDAESGGSGRLRVTELRGSITRETVFAYDGADSSWLFSQGNGLRQERTVIVSDPITGLRTEHLAILEQNGGVVSRTDRLYFAYPWGDEIIAETLDPEGAGLVTTSQYVDNENEPGFGQLRRRTHPDGSVETYSYDAAGRPVRTEQPFATGATGAGTRVTERTYATIADADGDSQGEQLTTSVEKILGRETARSYVLEWSKPVSLAGESYARRSEIQCSEAGAAWDTAGNLVTETLAYGPGPFVGRNHRVRNADGTMVLTSYAMDGSGQMTTTVKAGAPNGALDDVVAGTRTIKFTNAQGRPVGEAMTDIASGLTLSSWMATQIDSLGRPTRLDYHDGSHETRDYACCGLATLRDRTGTVTSYLYDSLGRQTDITRNGLTTHTTYDADGRIKSVTRLGSDGSSITQATVVYDLAGRAVGRRDALHRVTTSSEIIDFSSGQTIRTTTYPDLGTRIEVTARGGALIGLSGTAVGPRAYEYGVDADGQFTKEIRVGEGGAMTEWTKSYTDLAGRPFKTVQADGAASRSFYNAAGQLERQVDPDGIATLFAYDAQGALEVTALDTDANGRIDYAGSDRITRTREEVALRDRFTVRRSTTESWETTGQDTPVVVAVSEQSSDGLRTWQTVRGQTSHTATAFDAAGGRTVTGTAPDGVQTLQAYADGRLTATTVKTAGGVQLAAVTNDYDAQGRLIASTDFRNGTTAYAYNDDDTIHTVTTPDPDPGRSGPGYDPQTTTYAYDDAGRVSAETLPDDGVVYTTYWPTWAVKRTWGARTYPVEYSYDPQGRVKTMTTWQDYSADSGRAVTIWNYDSVRGWLNNKRYADNSGPIYSYKPSGRLQTRTWARGIVTHYAYTAAGDLSGTTDSDNTSVIGLAYDRIGRPLTIIDASGTRTLSYDGSGALKDEDYTSGLLGGLGVHRTFDSLARPNSLNMVATGYSLPATSYTYDAASRLDAVATGTNSATYGYTTDSPLVDTVTFKQSGITRFTTTKSYDKLNRLASMVNAPSASYPAPSHAYTYNSANQRTRTLREDGAQWEYTYDPLGQVTTGRKTSATAAFPPGHDFTWAYDDIGNRRTETVGSANPAPHVSTYTTNALNQYLSRTVPGSFNLLAVAEPDARVSYKFPDSSGTWTTLPRVGDFLFKELTVDNATTGVNAQVRVMGVKGGLGPNGEDIVTDITRSTYLPQTPLFYTYDADGNLVDDARWHYTWDAENRLIAMETSIAALIAGVAKQKLEFAYDSQGRRFSKKVYSWNENAWVLGTSTRFLYDGWNMIAEFNSLSTLTLTRSYVWGLDLSGTPQGAGGVGGLLFSSCNLNLTPYSCASAYDGNGNVIALVDMATGAESATYEYNAFGEIIIADGAAASANPFRFSTKYSDDETSLLYYGFRYYNPATGRWLSRDPLEEEVGANLYETVTNNLINFSDYLGLRDVFVAIWERSVPYVTGLGSVGHVAVVEKNGSILLSQFPTPHGMRGSNTQKNYNDTITYEGRRPDHLFKLFVPDDRAFDAAIIDHTSRPLWDWRSDDPDETNCSTSSADSIAKGGIPMDSYLFLISPHDVLDTLTKLSKQTPRPKQKWSVKMIK